MADRIREAAANATPTPGNTKLNQVQDSMAELGQWSGRDYEGKIPTTGPTPVTAEDWDDPAILEAAAEVEAFREAQRRPPRRIPGLVREEDA